MRSFLGKWFEITNITNISYFKIYFKTWVKIFKLEKNILGLNEWAFAPTSSSMLFYSPFSYITFKPGIVKKKNQTNKPKEKPNKNKTNLNWNLILFQPFNSRLHSKHSRHFVTLFFSAVDVQLRELPNELGKEYLQSRDQRRSNHGQEDPLEKVS